VIGLSEFMGSIYEFPVTAVISMSDFPAPNARLSIGDQLNRFKIAQKIGWGYAAVLAVAIGGAGLGIGLSNHQENHAIHLRKHAQQELELKNRLQSKILLVRTHQQQLIPLLKNPEDFRAEYAHLQDHGQEVEEVWADLEKFVAALNQSRLDPNDVQVAQLLKDYEGVPAEYLQSLETLVKSIDLNQLKTPDQIQAAQAQLLQFTNSELAIKFDEISDTLVERIEEAQEESAESEVELNQAIALRNWTVSLSTLSSVTIATLLAFFISRSISRPLTQLEQVALQVIDSEDFSLRSDLSTQDEVGTLAMALNQLIEWVGARTQALESSLDRMEQTVSDRTQELNTIIDSLGDGLLVTGVTGEITRFNPTLLTLFGLQSEQVDGKTCAEVFKNDVTGLVTQNQSNPTAFLTSQVALPKERTGQARVTAIANQVDKNYLGSVVLIRDVTLEKEIDQMKTDFISTVSHELRTPLTSVLGFAKLIQKKLEDVVLPAVDADSPKIQRTVKQVRENLNIIIAEGDRLTSLINDVLDIAKIEAGKVEWNMQSLQITEIIDRAIAATTVLANSSNLEMLCEIEPNLPEVVGDRDRLIQVLINLISNAIKFTPEGTVTCRAQCHQGKIVVSIIDQGIGISSEDQPKVFEKFKQVGEVMTDKPKGTGLGLPICKQIVEHHNGQLWVESQLGQGSTFAFSLPVVVEVEAEPTPVYLDSLVQQLKENVDRAVSPSYEQKNILVVDDEPHIRELLRQELESEGYLVRAAQDGIEALQLVKECPPDLIILDVMMPNISGFDLAAVLKNNPATMNIPTIILSIIQDKERGYRLGVDRYLNKPIDTELLLSDIKTLLTQEVSHKKVLVVDADLSTTKVLTDVLVSKGYAVTEAATGSEGIEKALSIKPDMVIINADVSEQHHMVQTLRFDNGLENIIFIVIQQDASEPKTAQLIH
jgi:PAS domain S-box-containing protein